MGRASVRRGESRFRLDGVDGATRSGERASEQTREGRGADGGWWVVGEDSGDGDGAG